MKFLIIIFSLIFSTLSNCKSVTLKVTYINKGITTSKQIEGLKLDTQLNLLFDRSVEILRLAINDEYINDYKNNNELLEIEFPSEIEINSPALNNTKINKILLPLTGDLAGDELSKITTIIYYTNNELLGNPIRVSDGFDAVNSIYNVYKND